ncbi:dihydrolipoamide acetyltransferase family protein [Lacticigenium naphthae]|uniref:dihydrolipoamide acetyltransferase family protein n=1 Tax=Lacticigenium naphthae TaxID=515351 RepID=UPI0003FB2274|nr:dihydrolipoamide acetyltransferase family protein [Lacticigenium naphthae]
MSLETIEMPHLGESVTEASISLWLVEVGDQISKYDPIAEAISDKVTTEIPSNFSGVVKEKLVDVDTNVDVGTPILIIETETKATEVKEDPQVDVAQSKKEEEETANEVSPRFSPAVMRIAQEKNIDLSHVTGSGKSGRITRKDVLNFDGETQKETPPASRPNPLKELAAVQSEARNEPETSESRFKDGKDEVVPADGIRKAIAKKMVQSVTEIPHAWMTVEADVTNIVKLRDAEKATFKQQEGIPLAYFPFFVKAVVQALKKHPIINASWDNGNIIYHKAINISVAVATEEHLFVPVIHEADNYSVSGLTKEIDRLAKLARTGKLETKHMQGGTLTVNNTGTFGSIQSMGIINHPQAAILQVETIQKRFIPTPDGGFKVADMVNLSLSMDHRIIDGLQAGRFLQTVKENLARFSDKSVLY